MNKYYTRVIEMNHNGELVYNHIGMYINAPRIQNCNYGGRLRIYGHSLQDCLNAFGEYGFGISI